MILTVLESCVCHVLQGAGEGELPSGRDQSEGQSMTVKQNAV
jgi:hypothetical protein